MATMSMLEYAQSLTTLKQKSSDEWAGPCPLCGGTDRFVVFDDDKPGWFCRGCVGEEQRHSMQDLMMRVEGISFAEACERLGTDDRPKRDTWATKEKGEWVHYPVNTTYDYTDADGKLEYQSLRWTDSKGNTKNFGQRRPDQKKKSGWAQGTKDCTLYPYRLPELLQAIQDEKTVYFVEGEKCVDTLRLRGIVATTTVGGSGEGEKYWGKDNIYPQWFDNADVVVIADNDKPTGKYPLGKGQAFAMLVAEKLRPVAKSVVLKLSGRWDSPTGQGLDDWLSSGGRLDDLPDIENVVAERPIIDVFDKDLATLTPQIWDAVLKGPFAKDLYQRDGKVVYVNGTVQVPDDTMWRRFISRSLVMTEQTRQGPKVVYPDKNMCHDTLDDIPPEVRCLKRLTDVPVIVRDGNGYRIVDQPGYDTDTGILYMPSCEIPPEMSIEQAHDLILNHLLVDFPFKSASDRAHLLALLLLPFVRDLIDGPTPLHLIEAARAGTGKGLLMKVVSYIWFGKEPVLTSLSIEHDEQSKQLTGLLMDTPEVVVLDNLRILSGGPLEMALTADRYAGRMLGRNRSIDVPVRCVWCGTGNNVSIYGDMPRRILHSRMVALQEDPSLRGGFKVPDLPGWSLAHRGELIRACLTMAQHGLSGVAYQGKRTGSYERYCDTVGQILQNNGIDGFLGNIRHHRETDDISGWRWIVEQWYNAHGNTEVTASQIWDAVNGDDCPIHFRGETDKQQKISMGMMLKQQIDTVYSIRGGNYAIRSQKSGNTTYYQVVSLCDGTPETTGTTGTLPSVPMRVEKKEQTHVCAGERNEGKCLRSTRSLRGSIERTPEEVNAMYRRGGIAMASDGDTWSLIDNDGNVVASGFVSEVAASQWLASFVG